MSSQSESTLKRLQRKRQQYAEILPELEAEAKKTSSGAMTFLAFEHREKIEILDQRIKLHLEFQDIRQRTHRSLVIRTCGLVIAAGLFFIAQVWWLAVAVSFFVLLVLSYHVFTEKTTFEQTITGLFYFALMGVVITGFAYAYLHLGLEDTAVPANEPPSRVADFGDAVYFSVVTWTTLGYGDIRPTPAARPWAAVEALFGYCHMGLLIAYVVNILSTGVRNESGSDDVD